MTSRSGHSRTRLNPGGPQRSGGARGETFLKRSDREEPSPEGGEESGAGGFRPGPASVGKPSRARGDGPAGWEEERAGAAQAQGQTAYSDGPTRLRTDGRASEAIRAGQGNRAQPVMGFSEEHGAGGSGVRGPGQSG